MLCRTAIVTAFLLLQSSALNHKSTVQRRVRRSPGLASRVGSNRFGNFRAGSERAGFLKQDALAGETKLFMALLDNGLALTCLDMLFFEFCFKGPY